MDYDRLLQGAIETAITAGKAILSIYDSTEIKVWEKGDSSPLTQADLASNEKIMEGLEHFKLPMINEEVKNQHYNDRKDYEHYWIVDPLDGTKEFIKRNGEFTVNIALANRHGLVLGVIYVPVSRALYFANVLKKKAYKATLDEGHAFERDRANALPQIKEETTAKQELRIVGSRSHMNADTENYVEGLKHKGYQVNIVSKGSSLKFCLVAEGKADIYPRFAPTMEWDTAAGHAICNAVGLKVMDQKTGCEMAYNKPNLLNNHFLVSR